METRTCPCCERDCPQDWMQKHHLKTRRVDKALTEWLCKDCHRQIHALFSIKELRKREDLNTLEGLMAQEPFVQAVRFIRTRTPGTRIRTFTSNRVTRQRSRLDYIQK